MDQSTLSQDVSVLQAAISALLDAAAANDDGLPDEDDFQAFQSAVMWQVPAPTTTDDTTTTDIDNNESDTD